MSLTTIDALELNELAQTKQSFCVNEVEGLLTRWNNAQYLTFRGTEASKLISGSGYMDVIRDLRFIPWFDRRVGWSHAGFLKGARAAIERGLIGELDKNKPIYLTGHSLGGALALNAAAILASEGFDVKRVITFGAPKSFRKKTARNFRALKIEVFQYCNPGDPIPLMPFKWWGFRHINKIITKRPAVEKLPMSLNNHMLPHYREGIDSLTK